MVKYTIMDIAKLAGVAPSTVSKVMNNTGNISEKTRQKIEQIIEQTGYAPTYSAKNLASKKSSLLGVIYAGELQVDFSHPFFNLVLNSFKKCTEEMGYNIIIFSKGKNQGDFLQRARHYGLDGCLIIAGDEIESDIWKIDASEIPTVGVDIPLKGYLSSSVMTDNRKVGVLAAEHAVEGNYKKIGFIGGNLHSFISEVREMGYRDTLKENGVFVEEQYFHSGDYKFQSGYDIMKRMIESGDIPEFIFTVSDMTALGAIEACHEMNIRVPEDIKIMGCDDIEACQYSMPKLSTVRQDKERIGITAANLLMEIIENQQGYEPEYVEPELVVRQSTKELVRKG